MQVFGALAHPSLAGLGRQLLWSPRCERPGRCSFAWLAESIAPGPIRCKAVMLEELVSGYEQQDEVAQQALLRLFGFSESDAKTFQSGANGKDRG